MQPEKGSAIVNPHAPPAGANEISLSARRDALEYLRNGTSTGNARLLVDRARLGGDFAEFVALLAEARGHPVRPRPDDMRFGDLQGERGATIWDATRELRIGIVVNPEKPFQVSDREALQGFLLAAERSGVRAELVERASLRSIDRFDAYLIREDTSPVGGDVYRFAHAVERTGRACIDDYGSLIRCGNKAYQAVLFERLGVPIPKTALWFSGEQCIDTSSIGFPLVVKQPVGAFSLDVFRCETETELAALGADLFRQSSVLVVQAFVESTFDWRIGVCNSNLLYAAKYHYPDGHWQIVDHNHAGGPRFGRIEPVSLDRVPAPVKQAATETAMAIGTGLYGVDLKWTADGVFVLEINDNPDIDHLAEAAISPDFVYGTVIETLVARAKAAPTWMLPRT